MVGNCLCWYREYVTFAFGSYIVGGEDLIVHASGLQFSGSLFVTGSVPISAGTMI